MKAREKKQRMADAVARYLRQVGRKAQKGGEPNDRRHDRRLEQKLRRMPADEIDALLRGDGDWHGTSGAMPLEKPE